MAEKNQPHSPHENHRERMRHRVENYGYDSLEEHEALEYLLFFAIPRVDTNGIAHELIRRFGSFQGVLNASEKELQSVAGVGPAAARFLHFMPQLFRYYVKEQQRGGCVLNTTEKQIGYLRKEYFGEAHEVLRVLAMNAKLRLLRSIRIESGTVTAVDANLGKIVQEVVQCGAARIVIAHNHPGGVAIYSREDIETTAAIMRALMPLGIRVEDHIILGEQEEYSFAQRGTLPYVDPYRNKIILPTEK